MIRLKNKSNRQLVLTLTDKSPVRLDSGMTSEPLQEDLIMSPHIQELIKQRALLVKGIPEPEPAKEAESKKSAKKKKEVKLVTRSEQSETKK